MKQRNRNRGMKGRSCRDGRGTEEGGHMWERRRSKEKKYGRRDSR